MAQALGVVLIFLGGDDAVHSGDQKFAQTVAGVRRAAAVGEALDDALSEADAVVELAQADQSGVGGDLSAVGIEAESSVMSEGKVELSVALCVHGIGLPKCRCGLLPRHFAAHAVLLGPRDSFVDTAQISVVVPARFRF